MRRIIKSIDKLFLRAINKLFEPVNKNKMERLELENTTVEVVKQKAAELKAVRWYFDQGNNKGTILYLKDETVIF